MEIMSSVGAERQHKAATKALYQQTDEKPKKLQHLAGIFAMSWCISRAKRFGKHFDIITCRSRAQAITTLYTDIGRQGNVVG